MLVIGAYRVAGALPVLRWPFAGALVALLTDFTDLFLMDWLGGIPDYQRFDKVCDLAYMATFTVVALRWKPRERNVALGLLGLRLVGDVAFELTAAREVLFAFPNLFEFWSRSSWSAVHRWSTTSSCAWGRSFRSSPQTRHRPAQSGRQSDATGVTRISSSRSSGTRSTLKSEPIVFASTGGSTSAVPRS